MPFSDNKYNSAVKIFQSFFSKIFFSKISFLPFIWGWLLVRGGGFGPRALASAMILRIFRKIHGHFTVQVIDFKLNFHLYLQV